MSRYHLVFVLAAVLWIITWIIGSAGLAILVGIWLACMVGLGVTFPQLKFFGPYICRGSMMGKRVALTFDDGPDPRSTPALLELLRESKIEATFFAWAQKSTPILSWSLRL